METITKEEFDRKHGLFIVDSEIMYFEDGATRERGLHGFMKEPPIDEIQRLKNIRKFYAVKLSLSVQKFDISKKRYLSEARTILSQKGNNGGCRRDIDSVKKELIELKEIANEYKLELDKVNKRLEELMPQQVQLEKIEAANRAAHTVFIDEISKIEI